MIWGDGCGCDCDFGEAGDGDGFGTSKETDFFGFGMSLVDGCDSSFGELSSIFARRRNLSSREDPIEDINSSRSWWICEVDMESS